MLKKIKIGTAFFPLFIAAQMSAIDSYASALVNEEILNSLAPLTVSEEQNAGATPENAETVTSTQRKMINQKIFNNKKEEITELSFQYSSLSPEDLKEATFVHERFYTVLTEEPGKKFAIVGPLHPCIFVGLQNVANTKAVIFHKHVFCSVASLIEIAMHALELVDTDFNPTDIRGHIFTNKRKDYNDPSSSKVGDKSWKDLHGGKSQIQEIKFIKDSIVEAFNISDRHQIRGQLCSGSYECDVLQSGLGDYVTANVCILVDNELNLGSFSYVHEGFFIDKHSPIPSLIGRWSQHFLENLKIIPPAQRKIFLNFQKELFCQFHEIYPRLDDIGDIYHVVSYFYLCEFFKDSDISTVRARLTDTARASHFQLSVNRLFRQEEAEITEYNSLPFKRALSNDEYSDVYEPVMMKMWGILGSFVFPAAVHAKA